METEKVFRTKTGFCHITEDRIVLTRDGVSGNISNAVVGDNITRILMIYGLIVFGLMYLAYGAYVKGETTVLLLWGALALYLIYGIVKSLNHSATPVIERKDIERFVYNPGIPGLTRPRFEVAFRVNNRIKKRLIMLPGTLTGGQEEKDKAFAIFKEEGLLT